MSIKKKRKSYYGLVMMIVSLVVTYLSSLRFKEIENVDFIRNNYIFIAISILYLISFIIISKQDKNLKIINYPLFAVNVNIIILIFCLMLGSYDFVKFILLFIPIVAIIFALVGHHQDSKNKLEKSRHVDPKNNLLLKIILIVIGTGVLAYILHFPLFFFSASIDAIFNVYSDDVGTIMYYADYFMAAIIGVLMIIKINKTI